MPLSDADIGMATAFLVAVGTKVRHKGVVHSAKRPYRLKVARRYAVQLNAGDVQSNDSTADASQRGSGNNWRPNYNDSGTSDDGVSTQKHDANGKPEYNAMSSSSPTNPGDSWRPDTGGTSGGGGDTLGSGGSSDRGDDESAGHSGPRLIFASVAEPLRQAREALIRGTSGMYDGARALAGRTGDVIRIVLSTVPAQVLVTLLSIASAIVGSRYKERTDTRRREQESADAEAQSKAAAIARVRKSYLTLETALLKASIQLALRITDIVEGTSPDARGELEGAAMYSAYLLARYLGAVELLKRRAATLDLGFPAADRIFLNVIGRVQGVLAADDATLRTLQMTEQFFKPPVDLDAAPAGPLLVLPRTQVAVGEMMIRDANLLTYVEFCTRLDDDDKMRRWIAPLERSFRDLTVAATSKRNRRNSIGARAVVLQAALMDVVDFLDPGPRCRYVLLDARRRLMLGDNRYDEELEMPCALARLYRALGALRDGDGISTRKAMAAAARDDCVDVFVKAPEGAKALSGEWGDCPYSQRVLILLEEAKAPYRAVRIRSDEKPAWFHLLHPREETPIMYHHGHLVSESRAIADYIHMRLGGPGHATKLRLRSGATRYSRFHRHFIRWLCGEKGARKWLDDEIRALDAVLRDVHARNDQEDAVLFGGARFSAEDASVVPFLHHVVVAGKELKGWRIPHGCDAVTRYLNAARHMDSFRKTAAGVDAIVAGYGRLMRDGKYRGLVIATSLE